jgi:hypothetical protein
MLGKIGFFCGKSFEKSFFQEIPQNFPRKITFRGKKCTKNRSLVTLSTDDRVRRRRRVREAADELPQGDEPKPIGSGPDQVSYSDAHALFTHLKLIAFTIVKSTN